MPGNLLAGFEGLVQDAILFLPSLLAALVIFALTLVVAGLVRRTARKALVARTLDPDTAKVVSRIAGWAVIVLGVVTALEQVNFNVTGFLAGLGVAGLTIGFALQDIAKNFTSGLLLLIQQPFDIGDVINVAGYEGTVRDVSITYTHIETLDGPVVSIPNAQVYTSAITNLSDRPLRRRSFAMRLPTSADPAVARRIVLDAVRGVKGVAADPGPFVNVHHALYGTYEMTLFFYVDQTAYGLADVHTAVVGAVQAAAAANDVALA